MCVLVLLSSAFPHSASGDLTRLLPFLFPTTLVHPLLSYYRCPNYFGIALEQFSLFGQNAPQPPGSGFTCGALVGGWAGPWCSILGTAVAPRQLPIWDAQRAGKGQLTGGCTDKGDCEGCWHPAPGAHYTSTSPAPCHGTPVALDQWPCHPGHFLPSPTAPGWVRKGKCVPYPFATLLGCCFDPEPGSGLETAWSRFLCWGGKKDGFNWLTICSNVDTISSPRGWSGAVLLLAKNKNR